MKPLSVWAVKINKIYIGYQIIRLELNLNQEAAADSLKLIKISIVAKKGRQYK